MTICTVDRVAKSITVLNVLNTKNRYSGICLADNAKFFYAMMQKRKLLTKFKVSEKVPIGLNFAVFTLVALDIRTTKPTVDEILPF